MPALPPPGTVVLPTPEAPGRLLSAKLGLRPLGPQMLRVDLVERLARHAHEARSGKQASVVDAGLATSLGLQPQAVAQLMRELGFRPAANAPGWNQIGRASSRGKVWQY